jgi:S-adenosylmethionine:tRNA ribosyltransferase-isomerase
VADLFFDYLLPDHLIAQEPAAERDGSRLLVIDRAAGTLSHHHFRDLPSLLAPNDLLVLNDTKVLPARLVGRRAGTGGKWESLYLGEADGVWELLAQTRGFAQPGERFVTDSGLSLELVGRTDDRHWRMLPDPPGPAAELLPRYGSIPLPPYIRKGTAGVADRDRYQTVYAQAAGSVAAPTAGLHFTPTLLDRLAEVGVGTARVTLHVGLGTFAPVKGDPLQHRIHAEWCEVTPEAVAAVRQARAAGGRVVGVGTTTARTLEAAAASGELQPYRGDNALFIRPGHRFHALDGLITNFHLPRTTLLLLVQALTGPDLLRRAYAEAIARGYRFYSYGDAMLVL